MVLKTPLKVAGTLSVLAAFTFLFLRPDYFQKAYNLYRVNSLIRSSERKSRNTIGRLWGSPYAPLVRSQGNNDDLGRAQLLILSLPASAGTERARSLVDIGTGNWDSAASRLQGLTLKNNNDAESHNNLGVVFLELSEQDALYIFKALDQFELAEQLSPQAPEPHFNRLLILRRLQLIQREKDEESKYLTLEPSGEWHNEILLHPLTEEQVTSQLQAALDRHDDATALAIFTQSPEICRRIATTYATNPIEASGNAEIATFIAETIKKSSGDETISYMIASLEGRDRDDLIEARRLVGEGATHYLHGDLRASFDAYNQAAVLVQNSGSVFDHAWIDLNKSISELRIGDLDTAANRLENVVVQSRNHNFRWLLAMTLAQYGYFRVLNSSFAEMTDRLQEAIEVFDELGALNDSVRARFYMMSQLYLGGDLDRALQIAVKCLEVTDATNHVSLASVLSHVGVILYKKGFVQRALAVGDESIVQAMEAHNPSLVVATTTSVAYTMETNGQPKLADATIQKAEEAIQSMTQAPDLVRSKVTVDITKARLFLNRGEVKKAEELLDRIHETIAHYSVPFTALNSQTSMLLGKTYALENKLAEAGRAFDEAVDITERDSSFASGEKLQLAFDDGRRELYDSAIAFEYEHGATDAAWTYLQHYRAKLFIEILALVNPEIEKIHSIALDRNQVQKAIPPDLQVVEYALLPDRVLIWVVTKDRFETRSISIARDTLEKKVQEFLANLREEKPVETQSADLYEVLVAPIENLLDPQKALAIIPDRALHGLPFAAIQGPGDSFLIQRYPIIESPTLTHLLAVNPAKTRRNEIVAFGSRADDAAENRELSAMQDIYRKVSTFAGTQVTKDTFLDEMERAPVLHYAGHSAHDAADPLRSSILLDGDEGGPDSITAVDIVGHKLQPNALVVLSSCDSSVGNSKDGIGIRGLTSAFLISGAGAVVGSLWPVESTSTAALMIGFHKAFVQDQLPVAYALRKAQLDFIFANPNRTHPYYWSGFVVTANFSALR